MGSASGSTTAISTLSAWVEHHALTRGDATAYVFLADGDDDERTMTWSELHARARAVAAAIRARDGAGRHILLALPSGLRFIEALFGCWYAGSVAVPVCLPRHRRAIARLHATVADSAVTHVLSGTETIAWLHDGDITQPLGRPLDWIDVDQVPVAGQDEIRQADGDSLGLLQYTSGSTGRPKGVMVTHANLVHNSRLIAEACGHEPGHTIAGWLPLFHDMGLIGLVLQGAFVGARCVLMTPEHFMMRPVRWLRAMTRYGARSSPAPNMAYELCVKRISETHKADLDLSTWAAALNGSEPVRSATLERFSRAFASCGFRAESFFPCYGLAESTLFVTGPKRGESPRLAAPDAAPDGPSYAGCGRTWQDQRIAIVEPVTSEPCADGVVGEIWVAGPSCATGYWNDDATTAETFDATLADGERPWLRTGDLGFVRDGDLFVTGRLRDLVIVAGRNHFPSDLEQTVESAHGDIVASSAGAFSVEGEGGEELVVTAEVRRRSGSSEIPEDDIIMAIRSALVAGHELAPADVVLLARGATPRTTSGKIQRGKCRQRYLAGRLERLEDDR